MLEYSKSVKTSRTECHGVPRVVMRNFSIAGFQYSSVRWVQTSRECQKLLGQDIRLHERRWQLGTIGRVRGQILRVDCQRGQPAPTSMSLRLGSTSRASTSAEKFCANRARDLSHSGGNMRNQQMHRRARWESRLHPVQGRSQASIHPSVIARRPRVIPRAGLTLVASTRTSRRLGTIALQVPRDSSAV